MNILITGGCGAIGSVVLNTLKALYPEKNFINLDAITYAGNPENVIKTDNYQLIKGNICDHNIVSYALDTYKPNIIMHLAAETHVDNSFGNSFKFTETNLCGTHTMLECVRQYRDNGGDLKMFIHMSTDEVYGSVDEDCTVACNESSLLLPSNPYSATKAGAEMLCNAYIKSFKMPIVIVRCNNAVSPFQYPEKLIPKTIDRILSGNKIPVQGDGNSLRTFIDAYDIAHALDLISIKGETGHIYNIGNDIEFTVLEVIQSILDIMLPGEKYQDWITYVEDRAFQDRRYWIDDKILKSLGWSPTLTFTESLKKVISFRKLQITN